MKNPQDPVLVDEGKRVKAIVNGDPYYTYIAPKAMVITCPHENTPQGREERQRLDALARGVTVAQGGESHEI